MAAQFRLLAPDRLQIREGGGCLSLFGLPFLAAGIFMVLAILGLIPIRSAGEMPYYTWPVLGLMSAAFTLVGGTLVFGRGWVLFDSSRRMVVKQWGLLVPMREQTFPLDGYTAVTLGFVAGDSDTSESFPIALKARTGPHLTLCSFATYAESWQCAAEVARHCRLDLEDASTDHPIAVSTALGDAFRRRTPGRAESEIVSRPPKARSHLSNEAGQVRIEIPEPRPHPVALALMMIPIAIPVFAVPSLRVFFRRTQTPDAVGWVFIAFITIFFGILPLTTVVSAFLRSRLGATIVLVSTQGVRVLERGAWRTRNVASLEAPDIIDVDYSTRESAVASATRAAEQRVLEAGRSTEGAIGPRTQWLLAAIARSTKGGGITVKTRRHGLTTFGAGLEDDEIRYLYFLVLRALEGQSVNSAAPSA